MKILRHRLVADDGEPLPFVRSPNSDGPMVPEYLVIHYTAGSSARSSLDWFSNSAARASAHLVIGRDGAITQLVPFDRVAWHAGRSSWQGRDGLNRFSVGIELDNAGKLVRVGATWRAWFGRDYPDPEVIQGRGVHVVEDHHESEHPHRPRDPVPDDRRWPLPLKNNKGNYLALYGYGNGIGIVGDTTNGQAWKNRAVTFLENHDTGYRTNEDGSAELHHEFDSFMNDGQVEQGYAHILTHPGVPCVYWKHYFGWGTDLQAKIRALINARKVAGIHSGSAVYTQQNAQARGVYAAAVTGYFGVLYVRIGGSDADWQPSYSDYRDYREYARGSGWNVWVGLPGNPDFQQAPLKTPLPVPEYRGPEEIAVPDEWLN